MTDRSDANTRSPSPQGPRYGVRSLVVGRSLIPGPELFWMSAWGEWLPLTFQVVLIEGPGARILVNTGPGPDIEPMNTLWARMLGEKSRMERTRGEFIVDVLASVGLAPADITHVVCTPFQLYTTSNLPLFANAEVCLSKRGWVHFHTTHEHPHDVRWNSIPRDVLGWLVADHWDQVRLLEDEDTVLPGVRTWWAGTHHRASIAVEIDTDAGVVVASDAFFCYANVEQNRMLGISESMAEGLAAYARARRVADHLLPLYDPAVFDRYLGGVIARRP